MVEVAQIKSIIITSNLMFLGKKTAVYKELAAFSLLLFLTLLNINVIRIYKDTLSIVGVGVPKIGLVKGILELPFSVLLMYTCAKLHTNLGRLPCFLITIFFFTSFFYCFGFLFYPNQAVFSAKVESLINAATLNLAWKNVFFETAMLCLKTVVLQAPYVFLYIFGEVWVVVLYGYLIWSFIQVKTSKESAKKHFPIYTLIGQISIICSGYILLKAKYTINQLIGIHCEVKILALLILMTSIMLTLSYFINYISFSTVVLDGKKTNVQQIQRKKNYIVDIIEFLKKQANIRQMFIILICYGFLATLIHLIWFHYLTIYYDNNTSKLIDIQSYLNYFIGSFTIILGIMSKFVFKRFNWETIFLSVPIISGIFAILFIGLVITTNSLGGLEYKGVSITYITIIIGNIYYILSRALKYILFDTSKEIFFSWYNKNELVLSQGKSLVDVLAFKIGKSTGAFCATLALIFIQQQVFLGFSYAILLVSTTGAYYLWLLSGKKIRCNSIA